MKKIFKRFLTCIILCITITSLCGCNQNQTTDATFLVTDLNDNPIASATVTFKEYNFTTTTDVCGKVQADRLNIRHTDINADRNWFGVTLTIKADGYVPMVIFNFVLYEDKTRSATIRLFDDDGTIPFTAYVEIPSAKEIKRLLM